MKLQDIRKYEIDWPFRRFSISISATAAWAKQFPAEFYREIFRLRGWTWKGMKINRPQCVAQYTKNIVYARLTKGMLQELEHHNATLESGRRKGPHAGLLTEDVGDPALAQHLYGVIGLMRVCEDRDWDTFMKLLNKAYPRRTTTRYSRT